MQIGMEISQDVLRGEGKYIPSGEVIVSHPSCFLLSITDALPFLLNSL